MKITIEFFKDSEEHPLIKGNYGALISQEGKPDIVIAGKDQSRAKNKSINYLAYALENYFRAFLPQIQYQIKSLDED